MTIPPIGYNAPPLPPKYLELHEITKNVLPVKGYRHPTEFLRLTFLHKDGGDPTAHPAFPHVYSMLKQREPHLELIRDIYHASEYRNAQHFTHWMKRHSEMFYPVFDVLTMYDNREHRHEYKSTRGRMFDLTVHILTSLDDPSYAGRRVSTSLEPGTQKLVTLAFAHLCSDRSLFPHTPLRTPDHAARHWERVIKGETRECLLEHGHNQEGIIALLSKRTFRDTTELLAAVHMGVPALAGGTL